MQNKINVCTWVLANTVTVLRLPLFVGKPQTQCYQERTQRGSAVHQIPQKIKEPGCHRPAIQRHTGEHQRHHQHISGTHFMLLTVCVLYQAS